MEASQCIVIIIQLVVCSVIEAQRFDVQNGLLVGSFPPDMTAHGVSGNVFAIDQTTLRIQNFSYDGKGPDAYFWISQDSALPDDHGVILPFSNDKDAILTAQSGVTYTMTLPEGFMVDRLKYISVWCRQFSADFGHVIFPAEFKAPRMIDINTFALNTAHGVSASRITILDNRRIRIEDFSYDGRGPDAYFLVGRGDIIAENGIVVPNEMGSLDKLGMYDKKTIVLMLPEGVFINNVEWLSVYCKQAATSFGDVVIPQNVIVPPYIEMAYYGEEVGELTGYEHSVRGKVYVVDNMKLWLRDFSYDGNGHDVRFRVGRKREHGSTPNRNGIDIPDEKASTGNLHAYNRQNVVLTLPSGMSVSEIAWLSVWDKHTESDFGSVLFPSSGINVPEPMNLGQLRGLAHGTRSGDVVIVNKRQIQIYNMYYDGQGPDAFFVVGRGSDVSAQNGVKIPDEQGSLMKLKRYMGQTITLTLPKSMTVDDIDWLSVYCISFTENFGDVRLPLMWYHVPPYIEREKLSTLPNCESMDENFNVAWAIDGNDIELEFTGKIDTDNGYMAFGLSGEGRQSTMLGADVMVAYLHHGMPKIKDYTINQYSLCSGGNGVCPDTVRGGADNLYPISSSVNNGVTSVRLRRPLVAADPNLDKAIPTDAAVYVVWALGNVNADMMVTKHKKTNENRQMKIEFGRIPAYKCREIMEDEREKKEETVKPWKIPKISGKNVKIFRARIGPTAGKRGYEGITGQVSWGIAWYINGYLIPELIVKRGETYTFKVEGGDDPSNQAQYHPLYITDDSRGGYSAKDEQQKAEVRLLAGIKRNSTGVYGTDGRYCEYISDADPLNYETFEDFSQTLELKCVEGKTAGQFNWTVSMDTPDLVYYQCFTHNYLGWKIHVVDEFPDTAITPNGKKPVVFGGGSSLSASLLLLIVITVVVCL